MHVHADCKRSLSVRGRIHASSQIVLRPFAIPVQRNACEPGDDLRLGVRTISVQGRGRLYSRECCDTAIVSGKVFPS